MIRVVGLSIYPVKGLRGIAMDRIEVERQGPRGDRRWAVVRPGGKAITQRDLPAMARVSAVPTPTGLLLAADGFGTVDAVPTHEPAMADIWRTEVPALAANRDATAWLSAVLEIPCSLIYMADPAARAVTPDLAQAGDVVSLADGFPLLVTVAASLAAVNARLVTAVPMERFRANLVLDGAEAWAEDGWSHLDVGTVRLRVASPCVRCTVTTLDQRTGAATARKEPLRTLGRMHRDRDGGITFGVNAIPETLGTITLGAEVTATLHT